MRVGSIRRCLLALVLVATVVYADPFAYVSCAGTNKVSVIDTSSNTVVATIPVVDYPGLIESSPDGKSVYVVNRAYGGPVSEIDTATNTVVGSGFPVPQAPHALGVTPDGKKLYVAEFHSDQVLVFDTATRDLITSITIRLGSGGQPFWLAITPDGKRAYVAYFGRGFVAVIDTMTNKWITNISTGFGPWGIAITPDGSRAYVTNSLSQEVAIINTATNTVVGRIPNVGILPRGIHISPDGKQATVGVVGHVTLIDITTNAVDTKIPLGPEPLEALYTPDGTRVYCTVAGSDIITEIDPVAKTIVGSVALPAGSAPQSITMVSTPQGAIEKLLESITDLDLKGSLEENLVAKLEGALDKLNDGNPKNDVAAANKLEAFINAVKAQRGKALTEDEADDLIEAAEGILDKL